MQQLRFAELDDQGRLVLEDDAGTRYALPVDDRVRAALRPRRVGGDPERGQPAATPREVQAMIRAGQSAEEVAAATGWELVRVQRFEGPVVAEREHVVGLAQAAAVRAHGRTDGSHTLDRRVRERLQSRGVSPSEVSWDAARSEAHGPWTVLVIFEAGGRERRATWHYDVQDRSLEALDDEARWLSEDEQALPGGLAGHPLLGTSTAEDETNELMATMRARRQRRQRRSTKPVTAVGSDESDGGTEAEAASGGTKDAGAQEGDAKGAAAKDSGAKDSGAKGGKGAKPSRRGRGASKAAPAMVDEVLPLEDLETEQVAAQPEREPEPEPVEPEVQPEPEPEPVEESVDGIYARTRHDPYEVSFDEFFGTDDEYDDDDDVDVEYLEDEDPAVEGSAVEDSAVEAGDVEEISVFEVAAEDDPADDENVDGDDEPMDEADDSADDDLPEDVEAEDVEAEDVAESDVSEADAIESALSEADPDDDEGEATQVDGTGDAETIDDSTSDATDDTSDADTTDADTNGEDTPDEDDDDAPEAGAKPQRPSPRRKGRPSVPSWDDIMFGASGNKRR